MDVIREHELKLAGRLRSGLSSLKPIKLFGSPREAESVAVISFVVEGIDSGELGYLLEENYGILSRTGLHCAPHAHRSIGTFPQGTVRFSLSFFNTEEEIDFALKALQELIVCAG